MRKGINQWSFPDSMDLRACFELARDAGFDGVELTLVEKPIEDSDAGGGGAEHLALPMTYLGFHPYENNDFTLESTPDDIRAIKDLADEVGVQIPSIATVLPFMYPLSASDSDTRQKGIDIVRTCLVFGEILGADAVLVVPGVVTPDVSYDAALARVRESLTELVPAAEETGVTLALENVWNQAFLSPLEFRDFIDSFDSEYVGAYFDVGNILRTGYGEHWIRILGDRLSKVHFCNFRGEVGNITGFTRHLLDGDVNWPAIMAALDEVGYDDWVTTEITPPAPHYPEKVIYDISSTMDWILAGGNPQE